MSHDFDSWEDVDAYVAEHDGNVEPLREMLALGRLQGKRATVVEYYLRHLDASRVARNEREQGSKTLALAERSAVASEKAAVAAERSAEATDIAAKAAQTSARQAALATIVSLVAIIVGLAGVYYGWKA